MNARDEIQAEVLAARSTLAEVYYLANKACALSINDAMARVGYPGNNDRADLVTIAALAMVMAENAAINGGKIK